MENLLHLLPKRPQSLAVRYTVTALIVIVFFLLRLGLEGSTGQYGFFLLLPAVFLSSVLFDRGSGFLATLLSIVLLSLIVAPRWNPMLIEAHVIPFVLFGIVCVGLATVSEALRLALERAVAAEQEKDLLLRELGHRAKNNLTIVSSILSLQARSQGHEPARRALETAVERIRVVAEAHDHLQQVHHDKVEMTEYLGQVCQSLGDALRGVRPIAVRVVIEPITMSPNKAVAIGLITNELVTNAFKYAFPGERSGTVMVQLHHDGDRCRLIVEDNGVGCPEGPATGLGTRLVELLTRQLDGHLERESPDGGCRVIVTVPAK